MKNVTAITACWNTKDLIQKAYESIRRFHPDMPMIIVDGSDSDDPCSRYVESLDDSNLTVIHPGYNIGHGRGAHLAAGLVETDYFLLFDSDVEMLKSPLNNMMALMRPGIYGVGHCERVGYDGFPFDPVVRHINEPGLKYLHPYFALVQTCEYARYPSLIHHGAPFIQTMKDIHMDGLSEKVISEFPILNEYIDHDAANHGGTGRRRLEKGLSHIEGPWEAVK